MEKEEEFPIIDMMNILKQPALLVCITDPEYFCGHITVREAKDRKYKKDIAKFMISKALYNHPNWEWLKFMTEEIPIPPQKTQS